MRHLSSLLCCCGCYMTVMALFGSHGYGLGMDHHHTCAHSPGRPQSRSLAGWASTSGSWPRQFGVKRGTLEWPPYHLAKTTMDTFALLRDESYRTSYGTPLPFYIDTDQRKETKHVLFKKCLINGLLVPFFYLFCLFIVLFFFYIYCTWKCTVDYFLKIITKCILNMTMLLFSCTVYLEYAEPLPAVPTPIQVTLWDRIWTLSWTIEMHHYL